MARRRAELRVRARLTTTGYCGCTSSAQDLWLENDLAPLRRRTTSSPCCTSHASSVPATSRTVCSTSGRTCTSAGPTSLSAATATTTSDSRPQNASGDADATSASASSSSARAARRLTGFGTIRSTSEVRNADHARRPQAHAARFELRLAVHPDRRPDVHRLGHVARACRTSQRLRPGRSRRSPSRTRRARSRSPSSGGTTERGGRCFPARRCHRRARGSGVSTRTTPGATSIGSPPTPTCRPTPSRSVP